MTPSEHRRSSDRLVVAAHRQAGYGIQARAAHPSRNDEATLPLRQTPAEAPMPHTAEALSARQGQLILDGLRAVLQRLNSEDASPRSGSRRTPAAVCVRSRRDAHHAGDSMAASPNTAAAAQSTSTAAPASLPRQRQIRTAAAHSAGNHKATAIPRSESRHAARERPHSVSPTVSRRRIGHDAASMHHKLHAATRRVSHDAYAAIVLMPCALEQAGGNCFHGVVSVRSSPLLAVGS